MMLNNFSDTNTTASNTSNNNNNSSNNSNNSNNNNRHAEDNSIINNNNIKESSNPSSNGDTAAILQQRPVVQTIEPIQSCKQSTSLNATHLAPPPPPSWGSYSSHHQFDGFLNGCYSTNTNNHHQPMYTTVDQYKSNIGKYHSTHSHSQPDYSYASKYSSGTTIHHPIPVKCNEVCCQHVTDSSRYPHLSAPSFQFPSRPIHHPRYSEFHNPTSNDMTKRYFYAKKNRTISGSTASANPGFSHVQSDFHSLPKYNNHYHPQQASTGRLVREVKQQPAKPVAVESHYPLYRFLNSREWMPPPPSYHQAVQLAQYKRKRDPARSVQCTPAFQTVEHGIPVPPINQERNGVIINGPNNINTNSNDNLNNSNSMGCGFSKTLNESHNKPTMRPDCYDLATSYINSSYPPPIVHNSTNKITINNITGSLSQQPSHSQVNNLSCQLMNVEKQIMQPELQFNNSENNQHNTSPDHCINVFSSSPHNSNIMINETVSCNPINYSVNNDIFDNVNDNITTIVNLKSYQNRHNIKGSAFEHMRNINRGDCLQSSGQDNLHQRQNLMKKQPDLDVRQFLVSWNDTDEDSSRLSDAHTNVMNDSSTNKSTSADDERRTSVGTPNPINRTNNWDNGSPVSAQTVHRSCLVSKNIPEMIIESNTVVAGLPENYDNDNSQINKDISLRNVDENMRNHIPVIPRSIPLSNHHSEIHGAYVNPYSHNSNNAIEKINKKGSFMIDNHSHQVDGTHYRFYNGWVRDDLKLRNNTTGFDSSGLCSAFSNPNHHTYNPIRQHYANDYVNNNFVNDISHIQDHSSSGFRQTIPNFQRENLLEKRSFINIVEPIVSDKNSSLFENKTDGIGSHQSESVSDPCYNVKTSAIVQQRSVVGGENSFIDMSDKVGNGDQFGSKNNIKNDQMVLAQEKLFHNFKTTGVICENNCSTRFPLTSVEKNDNNTTANVISQQVVSKGNPIASVPLINCSDSELRNNVVISNETVFHNSFANVEDNNSSNQYESNISALNPHSNSFVVSNSSGDLNFKDQNDNPSSEVLNCLSHNLKDNSAVNCNTTVATIFKNSVESISNSSSCPLPLGSHCKNNNRNGSDFIASEKNKDLNSDSLLFNEIQNSSNEVLSAATASANSLSGCVESKNDSLNNENTITLHSVNSEDYSSINVSRITGNDCSTYVQKYTNIEKSFSENVLKSSGPSPSCPPDLNGSHNSCKNNLNKNEGLIGNNTSVSSNGSVDLKLNDNTLSGEQEQLLNDECDDKSSSCIRKKLNKKLLKKKLTPSLILKRIPNSEDWVKIDSVVDDKEIDKNELNNGDNKFEEQTSVSEIIKNNCGFKTDKPKGLCADECKGRDKRLVARILSMPSLDDSPKSGSDTCSNRMEELLTENSDSVFSNSCKNNGDISSINKNLFNAQIDDNVPLIVNEMCKNQDKNDVSVVSICKFTKSINKDQNDHKINNGENTTSLNSDSINQDIKSNVLDKVSILHEKLTNYNCFESSYNSNLDPKVNCSSPEVCLNSNLLMSDQQKTTDCSKYNNNNIICSKSPEKQNFTEHFSTVYSNTSSFSSPSSIVYCTLNKSDSFENNHPIVVHDDNQDDSACDYDEERLISSVECTPGSPNVEELFEDINKTTLDSLNKPEFHTSVIKPENNDTIKGFQSNIHCNLVVDVCLNIKNKQETVIKSTLVTSSACGHERNFSCSVACKNISCSCSIACENISSVADKQCCCKSGMNSCDENNSNTESMNENKQDLSSSAVVAPIVVNGEESSLKTVNGCVSIHELNDKEQRPGISEKNYDPVDSYEKTLKINQLDLVSKSPLIHPVPFDDKSTRLFQNSDVQNISNSTVNQNDVSDVKSLCIINNTASSNDCNNTNENIHDSGTLLNGTSNLIMPDSQSRVNCYSDGVIDLSKSCKDKLLDEQEESVINSENNSKPEVEKQDFQGLEKEANITADSGIDAVIPIDECNPEIINVPESSVPISLVENKELHCEKNLDVVPENDKLSNLKSNSSPERCNTHEEAIKYGDTGIKDLKNSDHFKVYTEVNVNFSQEIDDGEKIHKNIDSLNDNAFFSSSVNCGVVEDNKNKPCQADNLSSNEEINGNNITVDVKDHYCLETLKKSNGLSVEEPSKLNNNDNVNKYITCLDEDKLIESSDLSNYSKLSCNNTGNLTSNYVNRTSNEYKSIMSDVMVDNSQSNDESTKKLSVHENLKNGIESETDVVINNSSNTCKIEEINGSSFDKEDLPKNTGDVVDITDHLSEFKETPSSSSCNLSDSYHSDGEHKSLTSSDTIPNEFVKKDASEICEQKTTNSPKQPIINEVFNKDSDYNVIMSEETKENKESTSPLKNENLNYIINICTDNTKESNHTDLNKLKKVGIDNCGDFSSRNSEEVITKSLTSCGEKLLENSCKVNEEDTSHVQPTVLCKDKEVIVSPVKEKHNQTVDNNSFTEIYPSKIVSEESMICAIEVIDSESKLHVKSCENNIKSKNDIVDKDCITDSGIMLSAIFNDQGIDNGESTTPTSVDNLNFCCVTQVQHDVNDSNHNYSIIPISKNSLNTKCSAIQDELDANTSNAVSDNSVLPRSVNMKCGSTKDENDAYISNADNNNSVIGVSNYSLNSKCTVTQDEHDANISDADSDNLVLPRSVNNLNMNCSSTKDERDENISNADNNNSVSGISNNSLNSKCTVTQDKHDANISDADNDNSVIPISVSDLNMKCGVIQDEHDANICNADSDNLVVPISTNNLNVQRVKQDKHDYMVNLSDTSNGDSVLTSSMNSLNTVYSDTQEENNVKLSDNDDKNTNLNQEDSWFFELNESSKGTNLDDIERNNSGNKNPKDGDVSDFQREGNFEKKDHVSDDIKRDKLTSDDGEKVSVEHISEPKNDFKILYVPDKVIENSNNSGPIEEKNETIDCFTLKKSKEDSASCKISIDVEVSSNLISSGSCYENFISKLNDDLTEVDKGNLTDDSADLHKDIFTEFEKNANIRGGCSIEISTSDNISSFDEKHDNSAMEITGNTDEIDYNSSDKSINSENNVKPAVKDIIPDIESEMSDIQLKKAVDCIEILDNCENRFTERNSTIALNHISGDNEDLDTLGSLTPDADGNNNKEYSSICNVCESVDCDGKCISSVKHSGFLIKSRKEDSITSVTCESSDVCKETFKSHAASVKIHSDMFNEVEVTNNNEPCNNNNKLNLIEVNEIFSSKNGFVNSSNNSDKPIVTTDGVNNSELKEYQPTESEEICCVKTIKEDITYDDKTEICKGNPSVFKSQDIFVETKATENDNVIVKNCENISKVEEGLVSNLTCSTKNESSLGGSSNNKKVLFDKNISHLKKQLFSRNQFRLKASFNKLFLKKYKYYLNRKKKIKVGLPDKNVSMPSLFHMFRNLKIPKNYEEKKSFFKVSNILVHEPYSEVVSTSEVINEEKLVDRKLSSEEEINQVLCNETSHEPDLSLQPDKVIKVNLKSVTKSNECSLPLNSDNSPPLDVNVFSDNIKHSRDILLNEEINLYRDNSNCIPSTQHLPLEFSKNEKVVALESDCSDVNKVKKLKQIKKYNHKSIISLPLSVRRKLKLNKLKRRHNLNFKESSLEQANDSLALLNKPCFLESKEHSNIGDSDTSTEISHCREKENNIDTECFSGSECPANLVSSKESNATAFDSIPFSADFEESVNGIIIFEKNFANVEENVFNDALTCTKEYSPDAQKDCCEERSNDYNFDNHKSIEENLNTPVNDQDQNILLDNSVTVISDSGLNSSCVVDESKDLYTDDVWENSSIRSAEKKLPVINVEKSSSIVIIIEELCNSQDTFSSIIEKEETKGDCDIESKLSCESNNKLGCENEPPTSFCIDNNTENNLVGETSIKSSNNCFSHEIILESTTSHLLPSINDLCETSCDNEKLFMTNVMDDFSVAEIEVGFNCETEVDHMQSHHDTDSEENGVHIDSSQQNLCDKYSEKNVCQCDFDDNCNSSSNSECCDVNNFTNNTSPCYEGYVSDEEDVNEDFHCDTNEDMCEKENVQSKNESKLLKVLPSRFVPVKDAATSPIISLNGIDNKICSNINRHYNIISISPSVDSDCIIDDDDLTKPNIKCSLPWKRIFNTSKSRKRKSKRNSNNNLKSFSNGIELGPAKIELRVDNRLACSENNESSCFSNVANSLSSDWKTCNHDVCVSPVVKVKRLILQRDPELTSYSESSGSSSKESSSSSSDEDSKEDKNKNQMSDNVSSPSSFSLNSLYSVHSSVNEKAICYDSSSSASIPKVLIKKTRKSQYKSFLKLPCKLNEPVVKLVRSNVIDNLALEKKTTVNLSDNIYLFSNNVNNYIFPTTPLSPNFINELNSVKKSSNVIRNELFNFGENIIGKDVNLSDSNLIRNSCNKNENINSSLIKINNSCSHKEVSNNVIYSNDTLTEIRSQECLLQSSQFTFQTCDNKSKTLKAEESEDVYDNYYNLNLDKTKDSQDSISIDNVDNDNEETTIDFRHSTSSRSSILSSTSPSSLSFCNSKSDKLLVNEGQTFTNNSSVDDDDNSNCSVIGKHLEIDDVHKERVVKRQSETSPGNDSCAKKRRFKSVSNYMFHCKRCLLVFNSKEEVMNHQATKHPAHQELHHCMLCQRSFSSLNRHTMHIQSRSHRRLELLQRCTVHAMHRYFTGRDCPRLYPLTPAELKSFDWRPNQPGCIHFYHHPSPLQLALQENPWGMKDKISCEQLSTSPSPSLSPSSSVSSLLPSPSSTPLTCIPSSNNPLSLSSELSSSDVFKDSFNCNS